MALQIVFTYTDILLWTPQPSQPFSDIGWFDELSPVATMLEGARQSLPFLAIDSADWVDELMELPVCGAYADFPTIG